MAMLRTPETKWSLYVFLFAGAFVLWSAGARFILANNDEGIYLASAMRMLRGELPYRDFFYYLPPGTPLIEAGVLRLFGEKLWAARIPLAADLAILTAAVFWLTARLANVRAGFVTVFCFLAFETAEHDRLVVDHRWDSSAWATLAIALTVSLLPRESGNWRLRAVLAGASAALAGWITTPVAMVGVVIFGAACIVPQLRRSAIWIAAGAAGCSACFLGWLAAHHNLAAALEGVLWPASHYGSANRTAYGWVIGGYANLFSGLTTGGVITVAIFLIFFTLPATLPVLALAWWPIRWRLESEERRWAIGLMLMSMIALMVSTLPRPDLIHLMYVSGVAYALGAALAVRVLPPRALAMVAIAMILMAATDYVIALNRRIGEPAMATRLGVVHGTESDFKVLRLVTSHVRPEDGFFAFPYWPNFYLFAGARNPTRFAYLQPGMFSAADERIALQELQQSPPRWILYVDTPPEAFLRIWPRSDPARLRFGSIEDFIAGRYRTVDKVDGFELRERQ
jgi:4-amino-4-deoxy-L-arabinose transferase-like glycosyltransferase